MVSNNVTELCEIAYKYGTDKCPQIKHCYTPYYYQMFKDKRTKIKKVLELGIGRFRNMQDKEWVYDDNLKRKYFKGASLKMWRDFFPNAMVYGADIRPETLFSDERITTFLCDERKKEDLENLIKNIGSDIDLVVDDASHHVYDQIFASSTILPFLDKGATYIIEDVGHSRKIASALAEYNTYVQDVPRRWHGGMLFVINK